MFTILESLEILQTFDVKHHEQEQPLYDKYVISPIIEIARLSLTKRSDVKLSPKIPSTQNQSTSKPSFNIAGAVITSSCHTVTSRLGPENKRLMPTQENPADFVPKLSCPSSPWAQQRVGLNVNFHQTHPPNAMHTKAPHTYDGSMARTLENG